MWAQTETKDKFVNLDKINSIEINPMNSVVCKIGDKGYIIGNYKSFDDAEQAINKLINCIDIG